MKIYQRPSHLIFDTENPNVIEFHPFSSLCNFKVLAGVVPVEMFEYDYLFEIFQKNTGYQHPIMWDFTSSYYYIIPEYSEEWKNIKK